MRARNARLLVRLAALGCGALLTACAGLVPTVSHETATRAAESGGAAPPAPERFAGVDLSYVNEMEDCGGVFRVGGAPVDPYALFAERGANLVRLRLWVDPDWTDYSTEADVTRSIRRAKAAGMQVLLDFHYSDDWADPQKQTIPAAWAEDGDNIEALATRVYDYTSGVLTRLGEAGLTPEMVQVGNETNTSMLRAADTTGLPIDWARNAAILNAGIKAVRDMAGRYDVTSSVMLHIAQPENVEPWFDAAAAAGVTDYDYIGVSYYPNWSDLDLDAAEAALARVAAKFTAKIIIVEVSYAYTLESAGDAAANLLGEGSLHPGYPPTLEGQEAFLHAVVDMTVRVGGVGVVYWEPAWISTPCPTRWGVGSHWENATLFDFRGGNELTPAVSYLRRIREAP